MNTKRFYRAALALLVCLGLGGAGAVQTGVGETGELLTTARTAAAAGDVENALALYDQILAIDPDNLEALTESARQLSWLEAFDEALRRYDRVLALDSSYRFARLERARVLSWSGQLDSSIAAYRELLADQPDDLDARIGLARVLSWSNHTAEARREYQTVLAVAPEDAEALLGVAQTWAWSGDLARARPAFEAAAEAADEPRDAQIGIAYLDLWEGSTQRALRSAEHLAARHPDNGDTRELLKATRAANAPSISAGWDQLDDSDDNRLTASHIEASLTPGRGPALRLTYTDYDVRTDRRDGAIHSLQGVATWQPAPRHVIETMIGVDRLEADGRQDHHTGNWGLRWRLPLAASWDAALAARREPYRYSVPLIDNRIIIESLSAGASGRIGEHWRLAGDASIWNLSDDNRRIAADLALRRDWQRATQRLQAGFNVRWLDWRQDLDNGYFDPSSFHAWGLTGRAFGPLGDDKALDYDLSLEAGLQSFRVNTGTTSNDPYYLLSARLGWQATPALRVEGWAEAGSYASQGAEDWRYTRFGMRLIHRFGM